MALGGFFLVPVCSWAVFVLSSECFPRATAKDVGSLRCALLTCSSYSPAQEQLLCLAAGAAAQRFAPLGCPHAVVTEDVWPPSWEKVPFPIWGPI